MTEGTAGSTATDAGYIDDEMCRRFLRSVEILGRKWNAAVLMAAMRGARRFVEYRSLIVGISNQMLSQRLRELEGHGLVERIVVPTTPVQISYRLTGKGESLVRVLDPLVEWSIAHER